MPLPPKKPGLSVGIVVGKPKGDPSGEPAPLKRLDQPDDAGGKDPEPDPSDPGDMPDQQDDGAAMVGDYAHEIASDPDVGPAFTQFLQMMCHKLRAAGGGGQDEQQYGQ